MPPKHLECSNTTSASTASFENQHKLFNDAYDDSAKRCATNIAEENTTFSTLAKKASSPTGMEQFPALANFFDTQQLQKPWNYDGTPVKPAVAEVSPELKPFVISHLDTIKTGTSAESYLLELSEKRDRLVAQLSPEQRRQYDEENRTREEHHRLGDIDPIAFPWDKPPSMPLHEAIERLTNPSGLTDNEEFVKARDSARPSWFRF
jgi:hypothetical protein